MRTTYVFMLFSVLFVNNLYAQDCASKMAAAQKESTQGHFDKALKMYQAALASCGEGQSAEINLAIESNYKKIQDLRAKAEQNAREARRQKLLAEQNANNLAKEIARRDVLTRQLATGNIVDKAKQKSQDPGTAFRLLEYGHRINPNDLALTQELLHLENKASQEFSQTLIGHLNPVQGIVASKISNFFATVGQDVKIWDWKAGRELASFDTKSDWGYVRVALSDDDQIFAASRLDTIEVRNVKTGAILFTLTGHNNRINALVFSPDGKHLISGSDDKTLIIWNLSTGQAKHRLSGHKEAITTLCTDKDGSRILSASWDGQVIVWNAATGQMERSWSVSNGLGITALAVSPDDRRIVTGTRTGLIQLWDLAKQTEEGRLSGHSSTITALAFSASGKEMCSASTDSTVVWWDLLTLSKLHRWADHTDEVMGVAFSADGNALASVSMDATVKIRRLNEADPDNNIVIASLAYFKRFAFSPNGNKMLAAQEDCLGIWDIASGRLEKMITGLTGDFFHGAPTPDLKLWCAAYESNDIAIWSLLTGKMLFTIKGHAKPVKAMVVSNDGKTLFSAGEDNVVRVWDIFSHQERFNLKIKKDVRKLLVSPDGSMLYIMFWEDYMQVWDLEKRREFVNYRRDRYAQHVTLL